PLQTDGLGITLLNTRGASLDRRRYVDLRRGTAALAFVTCVALGRAAAAADTTVPAGGSLTLSGDIVLAGTDSFVAGVAGGARCTIDGAMHSLQAADGWTGRIDIDGCDFTNMGTADAPGVNVLNAGPGATVHVQNSTFGTSGQISVQSFEEISF